MRRRWYKAAYILVWPVFRLVYHFQTAGRANIPEGAAILCANHSHYSDPVILAFACGIRHWLRFMAKVELFRIPVLGRLLLGIGAFPVDRGASDISAIRAAMRYLKDGQKIMMFPEGTRVSADDGAAAKSGAVKLAAKLDVPIVPVYIPRDKRIFKRFKVVIGTPYHIRPQSKLTRVESDGCAEDLMGRINALGQKNAENVE